MTNDLFLGGRVSIDQRASGYRAAIDPVLLAAACPAGEGQSVLDAGCGVGTASLCAIARTRCVATGIEVQPGLAELARVNASGNDFGLKVVTGSIVHPPSDIKQASFDHVICNPPFLPEGYGTGQPNLADHESDALLADWVEFCCRRVRDGGSVVFIHRADRLAELLTVMTARLAAVVIFPLWPREGEEARRVIVGGIKGRKTPLRLSPGLVLHKADGSYTDQANAILRDVQPIQLWDK